MPHLTDSLKFTLIGSGAVRVNLHRGGPAAVLQIDDDPWLFDCGRNTAHQLERFGFPVESIQTIFITHLHFDHICDLPYLILLGWNNGRTRPLQLVGPPGLGDFLQHAVREAYEPDIASRLAHGKSDSGLRWQVSEIDTAGSCYGQGDTAVTVLPTPHAGLVNLNFRIDRGDRGVVMTSDTTFVPELIDFCQHADLLVTECSGTAEFLSHQPWGSWHMNPDTVARLAREADVRRVVLKHLVIENFDPDPSIAEKMAGQIRNQINCPVEVGNDGLSISI